jgi:hypothetical protein
MWAKWTLQSLWLPKEQPELERPGTDEQFHDWIEHGGFHEDYANLKADQEHIAADWTGVLPQIRVEPGTGRLLYLCDECNDYCDPEEDEMEEVAAMGGRHVMVCGMCRKGREDV